MVWVVACGAVVYVNWRHLRGAPLWQIDAPAGPGSPAERLRELDGLRRDGLVTEEEYERKRREILEQRW